MRSFRLQEYTLTFIVDGRKTVKIPVRAGSRSEARGLAVDHLASSNPGRHIRYVPARRGR